VKEDLMGIYSDYINQKMSLDEIADERKKQLCNISKFRGGRDILVYAADFSTQRVPTGIVYEDLHAIKDQLANLEGNELDLILETGGGSGEVAEDIVKLLRDKYEKVGIIVPGWAKSAGTIIAMAGDEILMEPASALGPIDAQIQRQGKTFSADAILKAVEKIKAEVIKTGDLNRAYVPILQGISPGELQHAQTALDFAKNLVADWLHRYKFKDWKSHSSGSEVTDEEREQRALEIASELCDNEKWSTHGRSIKIDDLRSMKLRITDYSEQKDLAEAIRACNISSVNSVAAA
jgi:hypothetical protein